MNISLIGYRWYSSVVENLPVLTPQQKIISSIALATFTILGAAYAIYRCCFKKQLQENIVEISKSTQKKSPPQESSYIESNPAWDSSIDVSGEFINLKTEKLYQKVTNKNKKRIEKTRRQWTEFKKKIKTKEEAIETKRFKLVNDLFNELLSRIISFSRKLDGSCFIQEIKTDTLSLELPEVFTDNLNRKFSRWSPLINEKKIDQIKECKKFLKNQISILVNHLSYRELSDLILKKLSLKTCGDEDFGATEDFGSAKEVFEENENSERISEIERNAFVCLKQFLKEEKKWNPSLPVESNEIDHDFESLFKQLSEEESSPTIIKMEEILSQTPIDYKKIFYLPNYYNLKELKYLIQGINDKKIDLIALENTSFLETSALMDDDGYSSTSAYFYSYTPDSYEPESITNFLGFPKSSMMEEYATAFFRNFIHKFRAVSYHSGGQKEKGLEKEQVLEDLKFILAESPNKKITTFFCDEVLNYIATQGLTPTLVELRNFLIINHLWYPLLSEEDVKNLEKKSLLQTFSNSFYNHSFSFREDSDDLKSQQNKKEFLPTGTEEEYQGKADRSKRDLNAPSATRWPRLLNDRISNKVEKREQSLNHQIAFFSSCLSNRDLSDFILQNHRYPKLFSYLKHSLKEQERWDPSPNFKPPAPPTMTMEEILSKDSINYDHIIHSLNPYDIKGLHLLIQEIQSGKIDGDALKSSMDNTDQEQLDSVTSIKDFLIIKGFWIPHYSSDYSEYSTEKYVKQLTSRIIEDFEALVSTSSEEEQVLFLNHLKAILIEGLEDVSQRFCDEILNWSRASHPVIDNIRKFLIDNHLWNPTISYRKILGEIDMNDPKEKEWLIQTFNENEELDSNSIIKDFRIISKETQNIEKQELKQITFVNHLKDFIDAGFEHICTPLCDEVLGRNSDDLYVKQLRNLLIKNHLWNPTIKETEIENLVDPCNLEELKWLIQIIKGGKIDLKKLSSIIDEENEKSKDFGIDEDNCYNEWYSTPSDPDPASIANFLVFTGLLNLEDSGRQGLVKKYAEILFQTVIQDFKTLSCIPMGSLKENENLIEKDRFLKDLKLILTFGSKNISNCLSDLILAQQAEFYTTSAIAELKCFLIANDLWNPTVSEKSFQDIETQSFVLSKHPDVSESKV